MPKIPRLKGKDVISILKKAGFEVDLFDTTYYKWEEINFEQKKVDLLQLKPFSYKGKGVDYKETDMYEDLAKKVSEYKPDLIGITLVEDTFELGISLLDAIKDYDVPVIAGGVFVTFSANDVINNENVDMVCIGEGEEALVEQMKAVLQKVSLPDDWAEKMLAKMDKEKQEAITSSRALVTALEGQITGIREKLDRLLDSHLEGVIDKTDYLAKKEKLINEKVCLEERMNEIKNKGADWLEPMREFILSSCQAKKIATNGDLMEIRTFLKNAGSNFTVKGKKFEWLAKRGWRIFAENPSCSNWLGRWDSNPRPMR